MEERQTKKEESRDQTGARQTLTVPQPRKVEFVNRPYPRVKLGSVLVKTAVATVCLDDRIRS